MSSDDLAISLGPFDQNGFLQERDHPSDGRAKLYRLTEDGVRRREKIRAQDRANISAMLSVLPPQDREGFGTKMDVIEAD